MKVLYGLSLLILGGCLQREIHSKIGPFSCRDKELFIEHRYQRNILEGVMTQERFDFYLGTSIIASATEENIHMGPEKISQTYTLNFAGLEQSHPDIARPFHRHSDIVVQTANENAIWLASCLNENAKNFYENILAEGVKKSGPSFIGTRFNRVIVTK